jgi:hypothetical protein
MRFLFNHGTRVTSHMIFTRKNATARLPVLRPTTSCFPYSSPDHFTLKDIGVHLGYSYSAFYVHLVLKWVFGVLKQFKPKKLSTTKFYSFEIYNFGYGHFSITGPLKNLSFKYEKFKRNFSRIIDFKWKSCQQ